MTSIPPHGFQSGSPRREGPQEGGFALIIALLALMLLTTLGLTLASTSSTELQISTNHRWAEQARENAEAGIEVGKRILAQVSWASVLPPARTTEWNAKASEGTVTSTFGSKPGTVGADDAWGNDRRDYEGYQCDSRGYGMGYGVVLDDGTSDAPYQYISSVGGFPLSGAFTLWVRRPVRWIVGSEYDTTSLTDYTSNDALILVSEGVAPFTGAAATTLTAQKNRATFIIETVLSKDDGSATSGPGGCAVRQGQAGFNAAGTNSGACQAVTGGASITGALAGVTGVGSGNLK